MKDRIFKIAGLIVLFSSFTLGWFLFEYRIFLRTPLVVPVEGLVFTIEAGMSVKQLANKMERQGLLENSGYLVWLARWEGATQKIRAGEYQISPDTTPELLIQQLVQGKVNLYPFTIVEGWTFKQLMAAINEQDTFLHTLQTSSPEAVMSAIGWPDEHPEGRFYPETYHFPVGTSDRDFLLRSFLAMKDRLLEEWDHRAIDLPIKTPYEALILASIVEKETAQIDEYAKIAGVFVRRLEKNMRLQTDPTVIYGMGERYKGNIRSRDLKLDTLYNTYTRKGLPPTPIAMPGIKAIQAALHPAEGKELYFVAKGDGSHYFSETLEQHNRAVIKYQLRGKIKSFSSLPKPRTKNQNTAIQ